MIGYRLDEDLRALGIGNGERLGVACSGGADSVALLHLLHRSSLQLDLVVLHVDHGLRPGSADDAAFVRDVAEGLGLPVRVLSVDVDLGRRSGPEAAAREARYAALERAAAELDLRWVATAHTQDDQAETVLLRALRGGSLSAIAPRRGMFVRPLLGVEGATLRSWLRENGQIWREDPTNTDVRLERNWIRGVVLPLLRERRPGVAGVLARLASNARADEEALDALAGEVLQGADVDDAGVLVRAHDLDPLPAAVAGRVVRGALRVVGVDPSWSELETVLGLEPGGHATFGRASAWRLREGLAVLKEPMPVPDTLPLTAGGVLEAESWGLRVRVGPADLPAWRWRSPVPEDAGALILRSREAGDRVRTAAGSRKVQDVLVDAKVPRPLRDLVPLLAGGRGSLAVVGLTSAPGRTLLVVDAEPSDPTWSKSAPWNPSSP